MELNKTPVDMAVLAASAMELIGAFAESNGVSLETSVAPGLSKVACDHDRILQVIINLMMNAVKFTPAGGRVELSFRIAPPTPPVDENHQNQRSVLVSVTDTGPGIAAVEAEALFNRFKQLSGPGSSTGSGLGLAISREIINMHGGKIWVESEPGRGSSFKFLLPMNHHPT